MKKIIIAFGILFIVITASAQLKVFSGGAVTIGNTTAPPSAFKLNVQCNSIFTTNTFAGGSAASIRGLDGFSDEATPDYTWHGDDGTGFFHPDAYTLGFTVGWNERARITPYGHLLLNTTYDNNNRLSVHAARNETALGTSTDWEWDYGYAQDSYVNRERTKSWVIVYGEQENFYVYGSGDLWAKSATYYSDST
jgi:hypothetical protein